MAMTVAVAVEPRVRLLVAGRMQPVRSAPVVVEHRLLPHQTRQISMAQKAKQEQAMPSHLSPMKRTPEPPPFLRGGMSSGHGAVVDARRLDGCGVVGWPVQRAAPVIGARPGRFVAERDRSMDHAVRHGCHCNCLISNGVSAFIPYLYCQARCTERQRQK